MLPWNPVIGEQCWALPSGKWGRRLPATVVKVARYVVEFQVDDDGLKTIRALRSARFPAIWQGYHLRDRYYSFCWRCP